MSKQTNWLLYIIGMLLLVLGSIILGLHNDGNWFFSYIVIMCGYFAGYLVRESLRK